MGEDTETWADKGLFRNALAALLVIHGLIHAVGPLATWGLVEFEDIDGEPTIGLSDGVADVLGVLWLVALVALVAAGVAVLLRRGWWRGVALIGVVISQVLVVLWWEGAWRGTIANALILAAIWNTRHGHPVVAVEPLADHPRK